MKVLFVTNQLDVGGIETNLVRLSRTLGQRGHEVVIAARPGSLSDEAAETGAALVPINGSLSDPRAVLRDARTLAATVRRHRPDLIHVFSAPAAVIVWPGALLRRRRPPVVASIMGLDVRPGEPSWRVHVRAWVTTLGARQVVVMAPAIGAVVRRLPVRRRRIVEASVVGVEVPAPLGDDERRELRRSLGVGDGEQVVLTAGRLEPRKSHELFLRAAAAAHARRPGAHWLVAGDGALEPELRAEIARLGAEPYARLLGNRDDLPRLLGAVDVCVRPGIVEGFIGITVLEAQAVGTPVVSFETEDVRLAITSGETGLLVAPGDVAALGDAVASLLEDPERAARIGAAGHDHFLRTYALDAIVDGLERLYGALIAAPRGR